MNASHPLPKVKTQFFTHRPDGGFRLQSGETIPSITVAYETYGKLNTARSNAILLFHAMTGSHHAAGYNPETPHAEQYWTKECHVGWWDSFIGRKKALNTDKFYIICANYLGGCYGSTGPCSLHEQTGKPYGATFPCVSISDVVNSQMELLDHLRISILHAAIGPSTGGLMALDLAVRYPMRVRFVIPIAAGITTEILQRLYIFEQICAIETNSDTDGLMLARMIAHKTFVSLHTIARRAHGEVKISRLPFTFHHTKSAEESYMIHQGQKFIQRFDRYSYLLILEMWLNFNLQQESDSPTLQSLFAACRAQQYLIFSISSDVCFYPEQQNTLHRMLQEVYVPSTYITVHSDKGHDSFLLEPHLYTPYLRYTLEETEHSPLS